MKVPPKRKGNTSRDDLEENVEAGLNESPSEKEGKFQQQLLQSKASEEPQ